MNTPRKITDILPSTCQKLLKSVEICLSSDKNKSAQFFETVMYVTMSNRVITGFDIEQNTLTSARPLPLSQIAATRRLHRKSFLCSLYRSCRIHSRVSLVSVVMSMDMTIERV